MNIKTLLFCLIMIGGSLLIPSTSFGAVNYFGVEGTEWIMKGVNGDDSPISTEGVAFTYKYVTGEKTSVMNQEALPFYRVGENQAEPSLLGYVRTESAKVFFMPEKDTEWRQIYDFSLNPVSGMFAWDCGPYRASEDKPQQFFCICIDRKANMNSLLTEMEMLFTDYNMQPTDGVVDFEQFFPDYRWIEGIGSNMGPLLNYKETFAGGVYDSLEEVISGGESVYKVGMFDDIELPTILSAEVNVSKGKVMTKNLSKVQLTDLQGRRITGDMGKFTDLQAGIYILSASGRKSTRIVVP